MSDNEESLTVLVVDDDDMVRRAAVRVLARRYFVEEFSEPERVIARVLAGGVGAVVTDMSMPGMSGLDLARKLLLHQPALPVVLMTASGSDELASLALREGIAGYLAKPFEPSALLEALERAVSVERVVHSERRSRPGRARSAS